MAATSGWKPRLCFEVEKVIGILGDGDVRSYQVQWAPSWVSSLQLVGCEHLIQEYLQRQQPPQQKPWEVFTQQIDPTGSSDMDAREMSLELNNELHTHQQQHQLANLKEASVQVEQTDLCEMGDEMQQDSINELQHADISQVRDSKIYSEKDDSQSSGFVPPKDDNHERYSNKIDMLNRSNISPTNDGNEPYLESDMPSGSNISPSGIDITESTGRNDISNILNHLSPDQLSKYPCVENDENKPSDSFKTYVKVEVEDQYSTILDCCEETNRNLIPLNKTLYYLPPDSSAEALPTNQRNPSAPLDDISEEYKTMKSTMDEEDKLITMANLSELPSDNQERNSMYSTKDLSNSLKKHYCNVCGKHFSSNNYLTIHYRQHTGQRPYQCNICHKAFAQSSHLNVHERTHTGERPHACPICGRTFSRAYDMKRHERTHTREKPYGCRICGETFARNDQLRDHPCTLST